MVSKLNTPPTSAPTQHAAVSPASLGSVTPSRLDPSGSSQQHLQSFEENLKQNLSKSEKNPENKKSEAEVKKLEPVKLENAKLEPAKLENTKTENTKTENIKPAAAKAFPESPVKAVAALSGKDQDVVHDDSEVDDSEADESLVQTSTPKAHQSKAAILKSMAATEISESPIAEFLTAMKDELNITPDQIIAAIKKMDPADLNLSPEETMPKLIEKLGIKEEKAPRAQQLLSHLLQGIKSQNLALNVAKLSPLEQKHFAGLMQVDQSLRQLFLKDQKIPYAGQDALPKLKEAMAAISLAGRLDKAMLSQEDRDDSDVKESSPAPQSLLAKLMDINRAERNTAAPELTVNGSQLQAVQPSAANAQVSALALQNQALQSAGQDTNQELSLEDMIGKSELGIQSAAFKTLGTQDAAKPIIPKEVLSTGEALQRLNIKQTSNAAQNQTGDSGKQSSQSSKSQILDGKLASAKVDNSLVNPNQTQTFASVINQNKVEVKNSDSDTTFQKNENVDQLTQQTQSALKKGGGEMVMKLTPEGMGQVHLKVSVQDGKVHVQMLAESLESKKLLEANSSELKKSLELQNIHVDSLKIEVGDSSKMSQDMGSKDSNKAMGQQLSQQFSERNQNQKDARQMMNENGRGQNNYRGINSAPVDMNALARAKSSNDANRRLDLVA